MALPTTAKVVSFSIVLFIIVSCTIDKSSQGSPGGMLNCKKIFMTIAKKQLKSIANCTKEMRTEMTNEELAEKFQCVIKCALEREGLLNDQHKVTNETMQTFYDKYLPEDLHEVAHSILEGCVEDHSPLMNAEDPHCKAHGNFVKCAQNFVSEICP